MDRPPPAPAGGRERGSFSRYLRRFGSVLRRSSSGREPDANAAAGRPANDPSSPTPGASIAAPSQRPSVSPRVGSAGGRRRSWLGLQPRSGSQNTIDKTASTTVTSQVPTTSAPAPDVPAPSHPELVEDGGIVVIPFYARTPVSYEKVRAMFAKYDIPLDESTIPPRISNPGVRVEKPIRMRVRIICHLCSTSYSSAKVCPDCQHRRCRECKRWPARRNKKGKGKEKSREEDEAEGGVVVVGSRMDQARIIATNLGRSSADETEDSANRTDPDQQHHPRRAKRKKEISLTMPSRTGGQNVIRKLPRQRVRRTCCQCSASFRRDSKDCPTCSHVRCPECSRDPVKLDQGPGDDSADVNPSDAGVVMREWKKARVRVRWTCHVCRRLFVEGQNTCAGCTHVRCSECQREPPKRPPQQLNEAAVQSVQEKLAAVVTSSSKASDPERTSTSTVPAREAASTSAEVVPPADESAR